MRRALLGVLLMLSLSLAGCLAPSSAGWGDGGVSVSTDGMNATVVSDLTPSQTTVDEVMLAGCDTEGTIGDAANQTGLITIEGHLAASTLYTSHGEDMRGLASGVTAAVILEAMSYGSAEAVPNGQGARIPVKNWAEPLNPSTGSGQSTSQRTVNVEDVDSDSNEPWFVLGLLPASEHIAAGFGAVDDVHQPIRIEGYMVKSAGGTSIGNGLTSGAKSQSGSPCLLDVDNSNKGTYYVIVHSITLPDASVTMDGDADDEWVMGDVPMLGRGGYVVYFLTVAFGGGAALYVVSSNRVKGIAASQAKVLLGQENMAKAETARKAPKRKAPEPARAAPEPKKEKKEKKPKKKEDSSIGGFDLDAALSTQGSSASSKPERSSRGGSSVVVTEEASSMAAQTKSASSASSSAASPPWEAPVSSTERRSSGVTPMGGAPTRSGSPQRSAPPQRSEPAAEQPTVRRRRAVRKAAPEPEPEPEPEPAPAQAEEEEFSDFSF